MPLPAEITNLLASRREEWEIGEFLVAVFGAFLVRLGSVGPFDIGFRSLDLQRKLAGLESFFETRVPLRLELDMERSFSSAFEAVRDAVALAKREQTYARDAVSRYPALRSRSELRREGFWTVMAEQVEHPGDEGRPAALLTLVIAEEGPACRWIYDPGALSPDSITRIIRIEPSRPSQATRGSAWRLVRPSGSTTPPMVEAALAKPASSVITTCWRRHAPRSPNG